MNKKIKSFYIENFKAFKEGRWFDFSNLSILTGANSSGKSTLFKAVKFFAGALKDSDFPEFDMSKTTEIGSLTDHLVNNQSEVPLIRLGYSYDSVFFEDEVKIIYRIHPAKIYNRASVVHVEVIIGQKVLLQIFDSKYVEPLLNHKPILDDYDDPSVITLVTDLKILKKHLPVQLKKDTKELLLYLKETFDDEWLMEAVNTDKIGNAKERIRFEEEIYTDIVNDFYANLYLNESKAGILTEGDEEADKQYIELSNRLKYKELIEGFYKPLFEEMSAANRFFYQQQVVHIDFKDEILARVINLNQGYDDFPKLDKEDAKKILINSRKTKYDPLLKYEEKKTKNGDNLRVVKRCESRVNWGFLFTLLEEQEKEKNDQGEEGSESNAGHSLRESELHRFIGAAFAIFEINHGIVIDKPMNSAAIIYLTDKDEKVFQLADLGRGEARLIEMVLRVGNQIFEKRDNTSKKPEKDVLQSIMHIEEPEAYLHPKWQSRLADFFVFLVSNYNVQLIVETHSVYLIQKIQLMVARQQVKPNLFSILYFDKTKDDVVYRDIGIRADGMLKNEFGDGFYDESAWLSIDLLNAQNLN